VIGTLLFDGQQTCFCQSSGLKIVVTELAHDSVLRDSISKHAPLHESLRMCRNLDGSYENSIEREYVSPVMYH
jgi:hypothetical protein